LNPYTLDTIERDNLKGILKNGTFSAHFKYDSHLNRLVTFSLKAGINGIPYISFYEFDE
jgi:carotenoid cleavage dioxygenase-like enzyme